MTDSELDNIFGPSKPRPDITEETTSSTVATKDVEVLKLHFTQGVITIYLLVTGIVCIYVAGTWPTFRERRRHLLVLMLIFGVSCCFALYKMGAVYA